MTNSVCLSCMSRVCEHVSKVRGKHRLAARAVEILRLLPDGLANKEIAARLGLTEGTVKVYLSRLFPQIGVTSRFGAALWAVKHAELLAG